jgi:aspartyl protease family protein
MIELDPQDRLQRFGESRSSSFTKIMIGMIVVALFGGGGFFYWYSQRTNYAHVYASLGIASLPSTVELQPQIQNRLDQLSREPCYRDAIYGLADALLEAGYPRETDTGLISFAKRCGESSEILVRRYQALFRSSDFSGALRVADELVKSDPADPLVRYWRGNAYEQLKDFGRALTDYINTIQLMDDPATISGNHFYDVSRMYAALGRYCDAITPIEAFISFNPGKPVNPTY